MRACGPRVVDVECVVCFQDVRVVHECVNASDGCKSLRMRTTLWREDFNSESLSLNLVGLSHTRNSEYVTACAGVRRRWKCPVVDGVVFTPK